MINYRVITDGLRVRSGPGIKYEIIGYQSTDDVVMSPETDGWLPVVMDDDTLGWVSAKYLVRQEETEEPTPVSKKATGKMIVAKAMTQNKDPYIFGFEVNLTDSDPDAFDCSELVQWDCAQLEVTPKMPDGAANQYEHCQKYGMTCSIEKAVKTVGALLFRLTADGNHVAISRGDGTTIEARGKDYGVGVWSATRNGFTHAALIPGVLYG